MNQKELDRDMTIVEGIDAMNRKLDILIRLSLITLVIIVSSVIAFLVIVQ